MNKQELKKAKEDLKIRKFYIAVEELTILLKENREGLINMINKNKFVQDKDVEIIRLSLENLSYKFSGLRKKKKLKLNRNIRLNKLNKKEKKNV